MGSVPMFITRSRFRLRLEAISSSTPNFLIVPKMASTMAMRKRPFHDKSILSRYQGLIPEKTC